MIEACRKAISVTMHEIKGLMSTGPTIENLSNAKKKLIQLASHREWFSFNIFPLPTDDAMECSYLIHEFDDGSYALYVNSGAPHQYYAPHDHGDAWAIIAGIIGRERHQMYLKRPQGDSAKDLLINKGEVIASPGKAITMQPDGIHEVNVMDNQPLLHLHLYAKNFVNQGERWKYNMEQNTAERFHLDELGSINDAR